MTREGKVSNKDDQVFILGIVFLVVGAVAVFGVCGMSIFLINQLLR